MEYLMQKYYILLYFSHFAHFIADYVNSTSIIIKSQRSTKVPESEKLHICMQQQKSLLSEGYTWEPAAWHTACWKCHSSFLIWTSVKPSWSSWQKKNYIFATLSYCHFYDFLKSQLPLRCSFLCTTVSYHDNFLV